MPLIRRWLIAVLVMTLALATPNLVRAGGPDLNDEDANVDDGPRFFGFVRDADGLGVAGAQVSAKLKTGNSVVTNSGILGIYKIPGVGKNIDPDDVTISCAKSGYKEANVVRRPRRASDSKDPVEVECYLQKQ